MTADWYVGGGAMDAAAYDGDVASHTYTVRSLTNDANRFNDRITRYRFNQQTMLDVYMIDDETSGRPWHHQMT